jgi:PleD family two-component response regulator
VAGESDLVKRADAALYEAKGLRRDRVEPAFGDSAHA